MINKNLTWLKWICIILVDFSIFNRADRSRVWYLSAWPQRPVGRPLRFFFPIRSVPSCHRKTWTATVRGYWIYIDSYQQNRWFPSSVSNFNLGAYPTPLYRERSLQSSMERWKTSHPTAGEILSGGIRRTDVSRTLTRLIHIRFRMG